MIQRFFLWILCCFIFSATVQGQMSDNFSDENFTTNPAWQGDAEMFTVVSGELRLNAAATGTAQLATTALNPNAAAEWNFYVRLGFAPSDNNYCKIYIAADNSDFNQPLNGYFVRIGENGSADGVDFYKQEGSTETLLISSIDGIAATNPVLGVKIIRTAAAEWQLWADAAGGTNYQLQGTTTDNSITQADWLGVQCTFTSSNIQKFFFDNFYAGAIIIDTTAPQVVSVSVTGNGTLDILFDEAVQETAAENIANYAANGGVGAPNSAVVDGGNPALVHLTFNGGFPPNVPLELSINNIADNQGNVAAVFTEPFNYFQAAAAEPFDVLINEIFADYEGAPDVEPVLPAAEFVEIYNRSGKVLDLQNWTFGDASADKTLPAFVVQPNDYIIICAEADASAFASFGKTLALASFPSLNNDGDVLSLKNQNGELIHSVSYNSSWYGDALKENGGWTLEMIDADNPCAEASNWRASVAANGGTPGKVNSVKGTNPDTVAPELVRVGIIDNTTLQLLFDESVSADAGFSNYTISNGITVAAQASPNPKTLLLTLSEPLQNSIIYTININGGIYDCTGNELLSTLSQFAIPSPIEANDVVINEILFNPATGNVDFVELYNRSNKVIDLSSLYIANGIIVFEQLAMDDAELIGGDSYLLFPQEYVVLTTDPALVKQQYNTPNPDHFIQVSLPSYNDDAGIVILSTNEGTFIDWVAYFSYWHYALLDDLNGVSLERISSEATSNSRSNWHSAASSVGYATPAYQNSQKFIGDLNNNDNRFTLSENAFSPDGDSNKDYLLLNYEMPEAGYTANITIFDAAGREVRRLVQNDLLAVKGFYQWDGTLSNGEKAGVGMYVVVLEIFNLKGDSETFKKAVALTGNLD